MKKVILSVVLIVLSFYGFSQELGYEIRGTHKKAIVKETLSQAKTLADMNKGYPSSWIDRYRSVAITSTCDGKTTTILGEDDKLTEDQINLLRKSDYGVDITVAVKYVPATDMKVELQEINFTYTVVPKVEASYPGGYELLKKYLKEKAMDNLPELAEEELMMTIIKFTIDEKGQVINARTSISSKNKEIDNLLLQTITEMPDWNPAKTAAGEKVKQNFEFVVGDMIGC